MSEPDVRGENVFVALVCLVILIALLPLWVFLGRLWWALILQAWTIWS